MKWIFLALAFICFSYGCNTTTNSPPKEKKLVLKAIHKGIYCIPQDTIYEYCLVEIKLVNNTDTSCNFLAYNCLTNYNIVTDSKYVNIIVNSCSQNMVIPFCVEPNQTFSIPILLQVKWNSPAYNKKIKFGLVLIDPKGINIPFDFEHTIHQMKQNNENVLWSKPITFYPSGEQYKIGEN